MDTTLTITTMARLSSSWRRVQSGVKPPTEIQVARCSGACTPPS